MIQPSIRSQFAVGAGYLNTAAVGVPPRRALDALRRELDDWGAGRCDPPAYDGPVDRARERYAELVGAEPSSVSIVGAVSAISGIVAASLPDGARVLCAEEDFTSVLFPFLADGRLRVSLVPLDQLLDHVKPGVDLVAVSATQSADGRTLDLDHLSEAARATSTRTYVDVTQASGWLSIGADRFDVTGCGAYKWLCSPRGTGFMTVADHADWVRPILPGWYSSDRPWEAIYGPPLRLAEDGRRFNLSPAWFDLTAASESLDLLTSIGVGRLGSHAVDLANRMRAGLGLQPSNSPIVAFATDGGRRLAAAGISASVRAGKVRLSFWLYNDEDDVDTAIDALV